MVCKNKSLFLLTKIFFFATARDSSYLTTSLEVDHFRNYKHLIPSDS